MKNTLEQTAQSFALNAIREYAQANLGAFNRAKIAKAAKDAWQAAQKCDVTREQSTALFNTIDKIGAQAGREALAQVHTWDNVRSKLKLNRAGNEADGYGHVTVTASGRSNEHVTLARMATQAKETMQAACRKFLETTADKRTERQCKRFYTAANDVQWLAGALAESKNPEDNEQGKVLLAAREHCYAALRGLEKQAEKAKDGAAEREGAKV